MGHVFVALQSHSPSFSWALNVSLREVSCLSPVLGLAPFTLEQGLDVFSLEADHSFWTRGT